MFVFALYTSTLYIVVTDSKVMPKIHKKNKIMEIKLFFRFERLTTIADNKQQLEMLPQRPHLK